MKMMSIDSSTNLTGLCLFEDGEYSQHTLIDHHKMKDTQERIDQMIESIINVLQKWKPDMVWIEHPQGGGSNVMMVNKLSEILGAVRCWCVVKNREYHEINPSEWRKWLPGYSQGKKTRKELKQDSINYVLEHLELECTDDEADSICIGLAVLAYYKQLEE